MRLRYDVDARICATQRDAPGKSRHNQTWAKSAVYLGSVRKYGQHQSLEAIAFIAFGERNSAVFRQNIGELHGELPFLVT
jgi:hypothetical protein